MTFRKMHILSRHVVIIISAYISIFSTSAQVSKQQVQTFNTKQPSRFTENKGQITDQNGNLRTDVKYIYNAPGFKAIFKDNSFSYEVYTVEKKPKQISEATGKPVDDLLPNKFKQPEDVTVKTHRIDINLPGANQHPEIMVEGKSSDYNNYYLAHTPEQGVQKVYSYNKLTYKNIWPKVDIVFYAKKEGELKYDILVHPGGKLSDVKFAYDGVLSKLVNGNLSLQTKLGTVKEYIPLSYTQQDSKEVNVCYYLKQNTIGFTAKYNISATLVIDPIIQWASYFGGINDDFGGSITNDNLANLYSTGTTSSYNNISTSRAYQQSYAGQTDVYIIKVDSMGRRVWSTFYGGTERDLPADLIINPNNQLLITGETSSPNIMATSGAYQENFAGNIDVFLSIFDTSGIRIEGTYFGGPNQEFAGGVTIDKFGNTYLVGRTYSRSGIATIGAYDTTCSYCDSKYDGFVAKFSSKGTLLYGTYYGGMENDNINGVTVDKSGNIYIAGVTANKTSIATIGSFQETLSDYNDAFLVKFDSTGKRMWGTYYGGYQTDGAFGVSIDSDENIYLIGITESSTLIATSKAYQKTYSGDYDAFIVKFTKDGERIWGTYFGGSGRDFPSSLIIDTFDNLYLCGLSKSTTSISTLNGYQRTMLGIQDGFLAIFDSSGKKVWGTYYGGIDEDQIFNISLDLSGSIYLSGGTLSNDLDTLNSFQSNHGGKWDAFLVKMSNPIPKPTSIEHAVKAESSLKVYPNPFLRNLAIEYALTDAALVRVELYNIQGNLLHQAPLVRKETGKHNIALEYSSLSLTPGVYLLKLEVDGVPTYRQIVKTE